jgi:HEAT repeat protein
VLPRAAPVFALLERLQSPQVEQRRRAAAELRDRSQGEPLGELALARLVEIVTPDRDALVWMDVQEALAEDAREPVARLQVAGLSHPDAETRRRACEYFARHPHPRQEAMLLPSLEDESSAVVTAALGALAEVERLENPLPLARLLASREKEVRLATATTLARLGYESGFDALERLSYDHEPDIRREAAEAMGRAGYRRFVPILIRLLDDQLGVRRAALAALTEIAGQDIGQTGDARTLPEQVARWKSWYARGN